MINLRRTYLIARRDFLGYMKTWGFWISFIMPFVFGVLGFLATMLDFNIEPIRYETILDETGVHQEGMLETRKIQQNRIKMTALDPIASRMLKSDDYDKFIKIYDVSGFDAAAEFLETKTFFSKDQIKIPEDRTQFVPPPVNSLSELKSYVINKKAFQHEGVDIHLDGILHVHEPEGKLAVNYWSPNINNSAVIDMARTYFHDRATRNYLATGNLTPQGLRQARRENISIERLDPTKSDKGQGQAVTLEDRIPFYVAAGMSLMLWLTVFSGSYMLLTSMLEEKLNKLLEMMLASVRFSEIIFGKLIGVAALTLTAMLPYIIIASAGIMAAFILGDAEIARGLSQAFTVKLMVFFPIFLILGYVFYGAFFIALGALGDSMQDAQTLTTPIILILTLSLIHI